MTTQKMLQIQAKITSNIQVAENYFKMCLDAPLVAQKAEPGQFIYIKTSNNYEPLLRRAFSIYRVKGERIKGKGEIEILYKVRGMGTKILSERKEGKELDIIGPLGKGFRLPTANCLPAEALAQAGQLPILVGGGIGVAPLIFLAEKLMKSKIIVLLGAETKEKILCKDEFERLGCEVKIATDDGSQGFKGKVTALLKNLPATRNPRLPDGGQAQPATRIFACGPNLMLKEISKISRQYKISCQISLEEKMACGIGACRGCAVKIATRNPRLPDGGQAQPATRNPRDFIYKRVCKDGPVFEAQEIIWE